MTKTELIERWQKPGFQQVLKEAINCLKKNMPLSAVRGLAIFAGRFDLRGAVLSDIVSENTLAAGGYSYTKRTGSFELTNSNLEDIDFSFCDIRYSCWERCKVSNCMFEGVNAREIEFVACDFSDCIFLRSDLSYAYLAVNIAANAGSFIRTKFIKTNLSESYFYFPIVEECLFQDCNLNPTNFDGSRFKNCKFVGLVRNPWFRGYSIFGRNSRLWLFNRVRLSDYRNRMENVDFTEAKLRTISFSHEIPLDGCRFPQGEEYIYIKDINFTMPKVREVIESKWKGEDRTIGLGLVDVYYNEKMCGQKNYIISTAETTKKTADLDRDFYNLIKKYN